MTNSYVKIYLSSSYLDKNLIVDFYDYLDQLEIKYERISNIMDVDLKMEEKFKISSFVYRGVKISYTDFNLLRLIGKFYFYTKSFNKFFDYYISTSDDVTEHEQ